LIIDAGLLLALLYHGARSEDASLRAFLWALTLVPTLRLVSLSLPLSAIPVTYWYAAIGFPMIVATIAAIRALGFSATDVGVALHPRWISLSLVMVPCGILLGVIDAAILQPTPLAPTLSFEDTWIPALILAICTGLGEELTFRGVLQRAAERVYGRSGIVYVALLYATLNIESLSIYHVVLTFMFSLAIGMIVFRTRS